MPKRFKHTVAVPPDKRLTVELNAHSLGGNVYDKIEFTHSVVYRFSFPNATARNEFATRCRGPKGIAC